MHHCKVINIGKGEDRWRGSILATVKSQDRWVIYGLSVVFRARFCLLRHFFKQQVFKGCNTKLSSINSIQGETILPERKGNKDTVTQRKTKRFCPQQTYSFRKVKGKSSVRQDMMKDGLRRKKEQWKEQTWTWRNRTTHTQHAEWHGCTGKQAVSHKTKHAVNREPAIALLGIHIREIKTSIYTKTCAWIFIAALLLTAKNWKTTTTNLLSSPGTL